MTKDEIKEMLKDIIDNGTEYECKPNYKCDIDGCGICRYEGYCDWRPYKLGDKIHDDWEYRKVEKWCVTDDNKIHKDKLWSNIVFEGTKEKCEQWIKEHSKTWIKENYEDENWFTDNSVPSAREVITSSFDTGVESVPNNTELVDELEKENEQLKQQISILLSCSNCSENKGGYICDKEYNDKCLAQKIEYIKELQEEIAELKEKIEKNGIVFKL